MDANTYQKQAMVALNPALNKKDVFINSVMGLCGESGEAIGIVKSGWHRGMNQTRSIYRKNRWKLRGTWQKLQLLWIYPRKKSCKGISKNRRNVEGYVW